MFNPCSAFGAPNTPSISGSAAFVSEFQAECSAHQFCGFISILSRVRITTGISEQVKFANTLGKTLPTCFTLTP